MAEAMEYRQIDLLGGAGMLRSVERHFAFAPHSHDEIVIAAYCGGGKLFRCDRQEGEALPGDLLVIAADVVHAAKTPAGTFWDYQALYLPRLETAALFGLDRTNDRRRFSGFRLLKAGTDQARAGQELLSALARARAEDAGLSEERLAAFLGGLWPADHPEPAPAAKALRRVAERLRETPAVTPRLCELAAEAGVSPEHLSRAFHHQFGLSPFQWLESERVKLARDLIARRMPLAEAAVAAGFSDQSHMTRWFRRICGMTPGTFARHQ
ncbi:AraC family transcriptional regulator [Martelella sp. HB161492]|uniref:AraC family transcriptional regulator n=1 Tax=Martelella sp. HB161492 TaxID=2720726 RepID=UPI00158FD876|nr:AraC family transcriptional regulator [Martelella sp. HB161492]